MFIVRNAFIIEGGDKKLVDIYCSMRELKLCILGVEPVAKKTRKISKTFDRLITRIITTRKHPLECRVIEVKTIRIIGWKTIDEKKYLVLDVNNMYKIYVRGDKLEYVKECIEIVKK